MVHTIFVLAIGHHLELVGELESLVGRYPLREGLRGRLMIALYRSHRQAEALSAYQDARRTLVEGQRIASEAAFVWDGKDDAGNGLPPGLYLLRAEAIAESGLPPRVSEMPLAVAAGPR